jgi:hypothetical protein
VAGGDGGLWGVVFVQDGFDEDHVVVWGVQRGS